VANNTNRATPPALASRRRYLAVPARGVVMLYADSEEPLRHTHGSFFKTVDELLETV
jgi:hypothetical protein